MNKNTAPQSENLPHTQESAAFEEISNSKENKLNDETCSNTQREDSTQIQQEQAIEQTTDENLQSYEAQLENIKKEFATALKNNIPNSQTSDVPTPKSKEKEIDQANKAAKAIIDSYEKSENNRLKQQRPILFCVIGVLAAQLLIFNTLMFFVAIKSFQNFQTETFSLLLEFLKYYIGAVVLELIGLMAVIIKSAFSQNPSQAIKKLIEREKPTDK